MSCHKKCQNIVLLTYLFWADIGSESSFGSIAKYNFRCLSTKITRNREMVVV